MARRAWLCDNDVLVSLAKVHPKTAQELKSFRGLSPKEIDRSGEHILQAIKNGIEKPEEEPIERSTKKKGDPHTSPIADLIQTYVYFLATELEMIPRYLLTSDQAFRLVENSKASIEEWVRTGILNAPASQLIGSDLKDILEGRKGLIVKNHKLTVFSVPV
jgi:ribonuclease D